MNLWQYSGENINFVNENQAKSLNGLSLEKYFITNTGYKKVKWKELPNFRNIHGINQVIDCDFVAQKDDMTIFIDVCTTYRSSRAKQKPIMVYC